MSHRIDFLDKVAGGEAVIEKLVCLTVPLRPEAFEIVEVLNKVEVDSCSIDKGFAIVNARLIKNVIFKTKGDKWGDCVTCGDVRHCTAKAEFCAAARVHGHDCDDDDLKCKVKSAKVVAETVEPLDRDHDGKFDKVVVKAIVRIVIKAVKKDW